MGREVSLRWNMQMGRYMTAYKAPFLWPSREFLMICSARPTVLTLGSEGPRRCKRPSCLDPQSSICKRAQTAQFSQFEKARLIGMLILTIIVVLGLNDRRSQIFVHLLAAGYGTDR